MKWTFRLLLGVALSTGFLVSAAQADEGMWLFNSVPKTKLKEVYGFEPTQEWLDHLMLSSVRFNSGGSASFVSSNGLVLTNHHVASDTLYKLSTPEHNYNEDGFLAKSIAEEIKAPDLELNQLLSIEDVTAKVNAAVKEGMDPTEASKARQAAMSTLEKESRDSSGLRSDIVTLFGGGRYHLYRYKQYTDVRLVWAPEAKAAFFGGDADNFEYPRYNLDVTLFRVYENGKPAQIKHFLKMDPSGAKEGDLIFVSGNPGRTRRIYTKDAVEYQRDVSMPRTMNFLRRKEILLQQFSLVSPENKRRAKDDLFSIQNSRKAYTGMLLGIQDPNFIASKAKEEAELRKAVSSDPKKSHLTDAWDTIIQVQNKRKEWLTKSVSFRTQLYGIAENLVLMAKEDTKPSAERIRAYRDSGRDSLLLQLYSEAPLYEDLERTLLADELSRLIDDRGGNDPVVMKALAGRNPRERATDIIARTSLFSVPERKKLAAGGVDAIRTSNDPLIELARDLEPEYRRIYEATEGLDEQERQAYAKITEAKFAIMGESLYPDATFTLRLAFGAVRGYETNGQKVPAWTTIGGAFDHEKKHQSEGDWVLPKSWKDSYGKLNLETPFNFVCTADIIGGNSGSPVVSRDGAMVGIIFDGNIESLPADFYFSDKVGRAVAVHIAGVLEAMRTIYGANSLADEMGH